MTVLVILLIVFAALWLLSLIRLGGAVRYDGAGVTARLMAGPLKFTLYPPGKKRKPKKKRDKTAEAAQRTAEEATGKGGELPPFTRLVPLLAEAAGRLKKKIRIDDLTLHLTWASGDPAQTAMGFGRANAVMGMIWPILDHNFHVKNHDLRVDVDFEQSSPTIYCSVAATMTVGQLVALGLWVGVKLLAIRSRSRNDSAKKQEA